MAVVSGNFLTLLYAFIQFPLYQALCQATDMYFFC